VIGEWGGEWEPPPQRTRRSKSYLVHSTAIRVTDGNNFADIEMKLYNIKRKYKQALCTPDVKGYKNRRSVVLSLFLIVYARDVQPFGSGATKATFEQFAGRINELTTIKPLSFITLGHWLSTGTILNDTERHLKVSSDTIKTFMHINVFRQSCTLNKLLLIFELCGHFKNC